MDCFWSGAASGLIGLVGAVIGATATLAVARRAEKRQRDAERVDALIAYYAAVAEYGTLWATIAELAPAEAGMFAKLRTVIQMGGTTGQLLVARMFHVTDGLWSTGGRARASATFADLEAINRIDSIVGDWPIGAPMPDDWGPALRALRDRIEATRP